MAADADFRAGRAVVTYDPGQTNPEQIVRAFNSQSLYRARVVASEGKGSTAASTETRVVNLIGVFNRIVLPLIFGLIGFVTPCSLGINTVFLAYIKGKERRTRIRQAVAFALTRGLFLAVLGLLFSLIGQQVVGFQLVYRKLIGALFIVLGVVFITHLHRPLPMPSLHLAGKFQGSGAGSAVAMGTLFGLDIPACSSPLVFALLAQTVLVGDLVGGAVSLYLFGLAMSLPLVVLSVFERPNEWLVRWSRRSRKTLYYIGAGLLMLVGIATFSPRIMGAIGKVFNLAAKALGG